MRSISVIAGLATLLLTAPLIKASPSPPPINVTPDSIKALPYAFVFTCKDRDGKQQVGITVTPKKGNLSPGLLARLHLFDDKTEIAIVPLEETREGNKVTYWFQVAPSLLAKSRFEFDILSGKEETLPNGKTRFIAIPGTLTYYFNIHDYVATKTATKPNAAGGGHRSLSP